MRMQSERLCDQLANSSNYGQKIANMVVQEFFLYIVRKNRSLVDVLQKALLSEAEEQITLLRTKFLADPSVPKSCTNKFYDILQKYYFREEDEILECISDIAKHSDLNLEFWKRCPWIKDITFDEESKIYTISSRKGNFTFTPVSYKYQDELDALRVLAYQMSATKGIGLSNGYNSSNLSNFDYQCHFVSYAFSRTHPDFYAVTAICPNCFPNSYWLHSYNISDEESYAVDIANGFCMPMDDFERLIEPLVLDKTKGADIPARYEQIKNDTSWPHFNLTRRVPLKTLAFYQFDSMEEKEQDRIMKSIDKDYKK